MVAAMPACRAAQATAWPWFPALAVTTPAALFSLELRDGVVRAADLEGTGALEILRLQQHRPARQARASRRSRRASHARCRGAVPGRRGDPRSSVACSLRAPVGHRVDHRADRGQRVDLTPLDSSTSPRTAESSAIARRASCRRRATASASISPLRFRCRRRSRSPRSASSRRRCSSASQSSGTPSPRRASVRRIPGRARRSSALPGASSSPLGGPSC